MQPSGGPTPTTIAIGKGQPFTRAGEIRGPEPARAYDPNFDINTETYSGTVSFALPVRVDASARPTNRLRLVIVYQPCTNRVCLPPITRIVTLPLTLTAAGVNSQLPTPNAQLTPNSQSPTPNLQSPTPEAQSPTRVFGATAASWGGFIWLAVTMGAVSLLTPCVFPMVPITVSYFTNHASRTRRGAVRSALVYGLGIVLTFTLLGGTLAIAAGAAGLNRFAANPWVNLAITTLFVAFALNLFGVFELRLPVRLLSGIDRASRRAGTASTTGTLLMAATFTVTSLTCTAAFLGTLLVVAAAGEWQRPLAGLVAYSATFAGPFVILAAAPQLASQLPRSGPWLARVKVVMGFLEIAAAVKFLSNADLVWSWGIVTRQVVLAAWLATAAALALYLALAPSRGARRLSSARLAAIAATLAVAVWLASGFTGRRLGELEAFLPPPTSAATAARIGDLPWVVNDLDGAIGLARRAHQRVFIDFTGYTCTNCRWMEANMFPRPEIRASLGGFVRARLYTDGQGEVYERQQRYQQDRFKTVALPLYAIVDPDRRVVATFAGLTRDSGEFLRFLETR